MAGERSITMLRTLRILFYILTAFAFPAAVWFTIRTMEIESLQTRRVIAIVFTVVMVLFIPWVLNRIDNAREKK